jgi:hypothetical protein
MLIFYRIMQLLFSILFLYNFIVVTTEFIVNTNNNILISLVTHGITAIIMLILSIDYREQANKLSDFEKAN